MQEINTTINDRRRAGVRHAKKHSPRTDMTPMVDLGFLLVAFFVFTSELSKPVVTNLIMPKEKGHSTLLGKSNALTVLATGNNTLFYYPGDWDEAIKNGAIRKTNFSPAGLRTIIRAKQEELDKHPVKGEGGTGLMLLIKFGPRATYSNVVDLLDEAVINGVKRYAIVKPAEDETRWMNQQ
jgi:biopolymer transport protein ExbD